MAVAADLAEAAQAAAGKTVRAFFKNASDFAPTKSEATSPKSHLKHFLFLAIIFI